MQEQGDRREELPDPTRPTGIPAAGTIAGGRPGRRVAILATGLAVLTAVGVLLGGRILGSDAARDGATAGSSPTRTSGAGSPPGTGPASAAPVGSPSPSFTAGSGPARLLPALDPAFASRLGLRPVSGAGCPTADGATWSVRAQDGPLDTAPVAAITRASSRSELAKEYRARPGMPGWLTRTPDPEVRRVIGVHTIIIEGTSTWTPDRSVPPPPPTGCGVQRFERTTGGSRPGGEDLEVLDGDAALLLVIRARRLGWAIDPMPADGDPAYRLRSRTEDALVVDRRPAGVVAVRAARGALPDVALLEQWLRSG